MPVLLGEGGSSCAENNECNEASGLTCLPMNNNLVCALDQSLVNMAM